MLSAKAVQEFKEIYRQEFGEELTNETAFGMANSIINLCGAVYRPIKGDDHESKKSKQESVD